jgi:hypothetical protein
MTIGIAAPEQELPVFAGAAGADEASFQGPIGTIYYGLKAATSEIYFVTSCDAPVLKVRSIRSLLAALGAAHVAVPFLAEFFAALARGIPQIGHRFTGAATRRAQIAAGTFIRAGQDAYRCRERSLRLGFGGAEFRPQLSTPEDHQQAVRRWCGLAYKPRDLFTHYLRSHLSSVDFAGA